MIRLENTEVMGWNAAIRGMRNPMNSWEKSDSGWNHNDPDPNEYIYVDGDFEGYNSLTIGPNDQCLMMKLANGGPVHAKYRRMIVVYVDITAPLYWWKEFDTYKVGTVANSCSTMHKIHVKEFTLEDFSCEFLIKESIDELENVIGKLNKFRDKFINWKESDFFIDNDSQLVDKEVIWYQMIQLLPSSYNQRRTVMLNYEVLSNMYHSRKNHKLNEWREFCKWIESLPYPEIIIGEKSETN